MNIFSYSQVFFKTMRKFSVLVSDILSHLQTQYIKIKSPKSGEKLFKTCNACYIVFKA